MGYFLIDRGRPALEAALGYRAPLLRRLGRALRGRPTALYLGTIFGLAALFLIGVGFYAGKVGARAWLPAVLLLAFIPLLSVANSLVTTLLTRVVPPSVLPKLDFSDQVPASSRTMIVIPVLLTGKREIEQLLAQMEQHYLGNTDPHIDVGLLSDFADAAKETMSTDDGLLARAVNGVEALNRRHGTASRQPFYLFHRRRLWNPSEGVWMGWERKRGKLDEFNRLLRGDEETSFVKVVGETATLGDVRYVITLDADTELPPGSAQRLIGALAHPLNRAEFDPAGGALTAGYTILQPRTEISPVAATRTPFSRIFSGDTGIDLYTLAVSDVYQDLFGEGIYVGKGIYDVDAFHRALAGRVPENHLLSHDLFEGIHGRAALVSDIVLYEDYPAAFLAQAQRQHRWIRGDWQLLPWLGRRVPAADGGRLQTALSAIDRWKIADNLRRSLLMPTALLLLVAGWLWLPGAPLVWTLAALAPLLLPLLIDLTAWVVGSVRAWTWYGFGESMRAPALRALLSIVFLPHAAFLALDAIVRTLRRVYVTHRHLLEWTTSAQTARLMRRRSRSFAPWMQTIEAPIFALVTGGALIWWAPRVLPLALPFLVAWLVAPLVAARISRMSDQPRPVLTSEDAQQLRNLAKRTWLYFEHFVGPEDNWLPPDHFQEAPLGVVAHRTSPTNIGLMLLATAAAYDFGYESLLSVAVRLRNTFSTLDELERHQGHFLNWYATQSLQPLAPRYISMVDSGNLAACLIALQRSLIDMTT
ncbi:MAG: hypothetical protein KDD83_12620, partial [Caldilineaceae bacterium]|nr:hypothetical protein [Caldilineaceae bacterium]